MADIIVPELPSWCLMEEEEKEEGEEGREEGQDGSRRRRRREFQNEVCDD